MIRKRIKTIALVAILTTMFAAPLTAQVFLQKQKSDISPRATKAGNGQEWIIVPMQGIDIDQYAFTPLGGGIALLAGMAGLYAFAKRKK